MQPEITERDRAISAAARKIAFDRHEARDAVRKEMRKQRKIRKQRGIKLSTRSGAKNRGAFGRNPVMMAAPMIKKADFYAKQYANA